MKTKFLMIIAISLFFTATALAQRGGKTELNRLRFAKGKNTITLPGKLKNNEELQYIFAAKAGQTVTINISSIPTGNYTYFSILAKNSNFISERNVNYDWTFTAPETDDYFLTINNRPQGTVKSAKFVLTLKITK